ncbi:MAG: hypothetical protein IPI72_07360 [Flavobacteriales bacterium]|nr:hypothetical protein [Flavobacteriales bacterium]
MRSTSILLFLLLLPVGVHAQSSLDSMLRILPGQRGAERAITLTNIGYETALSDAAKGKVHVDEAVAIATAIGDSALLATCLNEPALIEHRLGHFRPAIAIQSTGPAHAQNAQGHTRHCGQPWQDRCGIGGTGAVR